MHQGALKESKTLWIESKVIINKGSIIKKKGYWLWMRLASSLLEIDWYYLIVNSSLFDS